MADGTQQTTGQVKGGIANLTNAGKGRKKGVPNKTTLIAKEAIAVAFDKLGGVDRLVAWAKEDEKNESAFWTSIYPKLLPLQLTGEGGGALIHEVRRVLVDPQVMS